MTTQKRGSAAFAVCGSFCTLETALEAARMLTLQGWDLLPIMSFAAGQDTRFGTGTFWKERLEALTGHPVLDTLQAVEPLGPRQMAQALVIAPCTGATLARLAAGLSDTPVTLAAKSLLRVGCPVLVGISTNDGLGASGENIARLFQRKHYYFVPYGQDDPIAKPSSLPVCPPHWTLRWPGGSCSPFCCKTTSEWLFSRDKMWYTEFDALPVRYGGAE